MIPAANHRADDLRFFEFLIAVNSREGFSTPDFHIKIALWLELNIEEPLLVLQAFRDAGKSRLISAYVAWRLRRDPNFTCLIVSAKRDRARRNSAYIRLLIEKSLLTQDMVGDGDLWQRQTFTVKRSVAKLEPSVAVTSLESDSVGLHSDLIIIDDGETRESTRTGAARELLRERLQEFTALSHHHIYIGQPHGNPSIYTEIGARPHCRSLSFPIYVENEDGDRTYTWPERFPASKVEQKRSEVTSPFWNSQYLLIPESIESSTLPVEFIRTYSDEIVHDSSAVSVWSDKTKHLATIGDNELVDLVAAYDPAQSREGTDDAVVAIVARDQSDNTYVHRVIKLPPVHPERGWADQCDAVIDACIATGCAKIIVESNVNKAMVSELKAAGNRRGNRLRIAISDVHSTKNKAVRIAEALETIMGSGRMLAHVQVASSPFYEQARDFPNCTKGKAKNDAIDAVALGVAYLRKLPTIWSGQARSLNGFGKATSSQLNPGSKGPGERQPQRDRWASISRRRI